MKTALVCDWLMSGVGGGEKVLAAIRSLYPSPIYTLVTDRDKLKGTPFEEAEVHASFLQKIPMGKRIFRNLLPLFPLAIEQFDLSAYELILSSSHCVAKGVLTHSEQKHICYCHTPVRYAWDLTHQYLREAGLERGVKGALARLFLHRIRAWDVGAVNRVDAFIANSNVVARRIQKYWGRESTVIYPPVDLSYFRLHEKKESYYVTASRFVPYKRMDLLVEAFRLLPHAHLVVIGDGPEWKKVQAKAGQNVELLGVQSDEVLREHLSCARAFLFAAVEDFGILPVEAMACGTPVIAYGRGGVTETVVDGESGLFYREQTPEALAAAIRAFEAGAPFDPRVVRARSERFDLPRFKLEYRAFVEAQCGS